MARQLNIDLRRKRIRHYHARRRRRSPLWRAFTFWWSAGLVIGLTWLILAKLTLNFFLDDYGERELASYQLPQPSLRLIHVSAQEIEERLRMGNARRSAIAMQDSEIGISLETRLPEPPPPEQRPLVPLSGQTVTMASQAELQFNYLPPLAQTQEPAATRQTFLRLPQQLTAVNFGFAEALPPAPEGTPAGRADFWVKLNEEGRVTSVLRLAPNGEESAWLKSLRLFIAKGKADGTGYGILTLYWTNEETRK